MKTPDSWGAINKNSLTDISSKATKLLTSIESMYFKHNIMRNRTSRRGLK